MDEPPIRRVEDYTGPFLVMAFVVLFFSLICVWELFGYGWALGVEGILWLALRLTSP